MKRKSITVASSYTLAALLVLGVFILREYRRAEDYKRQLTSSRQYAYEQLAAELTQMSSALQKCVYAGTLPMLAGVSTELYANSAAAKTALGELSMSGTEFEKASDFIRKTGFQAYRLTKKAAAGEMPCDEDYAKLGELSKESAALTMRLTDFSARLENTGTDARFSAESLDKAPLLLEGASEVTRNEAAGAASSFMGVRQNAVKYDGTRDESVPVYRFTVNGSGGTKSVEVTRRGGYIASVVSSHTPQTASITAEEALSAAGSLLRKSGIYDMTVTRHVTQGNIVHADFAYKQDGVICYPDRISVRVGLDNGAVIGYDSTDYITNHRKRELAKPEIKEEDARAKISAKLEVLSQTMAVIASSESGEVFCYEYLCKDETGGTCLVYINAQNGAEERIVFSEILHL